MKKLNKKEKVNLKKIMKFKILKVKMKINCIVQIFHSLKNFKCNLKPQKNKK